MISRTASRVAGLCAPGIREAGAVRAGCAKVAQFSELIRQDEKALLARLTAVRTDEVLDKLHEA
jgi:hypothetical protein